MPLAEVLYFKADTKYVTARTVDREYLLDEALTHLEEEFAERFMRLHRAVLAYLGPRWFEAVLGRFPDRWIGGTK